MAAIRAFLEDEFPVESLPSVEVAEKLVAAHRKVIEQAVSEGRYADKLAALQLSQRERRAGLERERAAFDAQQRESRLAQQRAHSAARDDLRRGYRQKVNDVRVERERN